MGAEPGDKRRRAAPAPAPAPPRHGAWHMGVWACLWACVCSHSPLPVRVCACASLCVQAQFSGTAAMCRHSAGVCVRAATEAASVSTQAHAQAEPFLACRDMGTQASGPQHGPLPACGRGVSVALRGRCRAWATAALCRTQPARPLRRDLRGARGCSIPGTAASPRAGVGGAGLAPHAIPSRPRAGPESSHPPLTAPHGGKRTPPATIAPLTPIQLPLPPAPPALLPSAEDAAQQRADPRAPWPVPAWVSLSPALASQGWKDAAVTAGAQEQPAVEEGRAGWG